MASLSKFKTNVNVVNDGEWITVGTFEDTFKIKTRGFTQSYKDHLNKLRWAAARNLNRNIQAGTPPHGPDTLPPSADDLCQGTALADKAFLDVDGLDAGGTPVTAEQFKEMLKNPEEYSFLISLALSAASQVHAMRTEEAAQAEGNLPAAS